ncbi:V-ubiquitin [Mycotypha africana]|uniref:V-ubiquitin n=1 Tax=Mycotypha africana TaxID=64632 RepID=UPI00230047D6|nr:V-ubiquitin [Mycotypha africana]KAI8968316.1 V-ubiquitin [Mycotypha africana]
MQIFLKKLDGKVTAYQVESNNTIATLKEQISDYETIPVDGMRLIHGGKPLDDKMTFEDYQIQPDSAIFLVLRLLGGSVKTV